MESDRDQSEFNMAVSYLGRLNVLLYSCDEAAMELNVSSWFHGLMALMRELSTEMKADEMKGFNNLINTINSKLKIYYNQQKKGTEQVTPELYQSLHGFEMQLRTILKKAGLQSKTQDEAGAALH